MSSVHYPMTRRALAAWRHMLWGSPMPRPPAPPEPPLRAGLLNTGELLLLSPDGSERVLLSAAETDLVRDVLARDPLLCFGVAELPADCAAGGTD